MRRLVGFAALVMLATPALADHGRRRPPPARRHRAAARADECLPVRVRWPANEQWCVEIIAQGRMRHDAAALIRACEDAFDGDERELRCLATAVHAFHAPASVIRACEDGFDGDENELACVAVVSRSRQDPAPIIRACEDAFDGDATSSRA